MKTYIIGFFFISIIGPLLHFAYDFSKHNKVVGLFSAVNESTWEHIKLALTPLFIYSLVDGYIYGSNPNYFFSKLIGVLTVIIVIPLIFYGYKIFTKKPILIVDITSFFITVFLSQYLSYIVLTTANASYIVNYISVILLLIIFGIYLLSTIHPIKSFIFKDPNTKKYGLKGHK